MLRASFSFLSKSTGLISAPQRPVVVVAARSISASAFPNMPLDEFRDKIPRQQRMSETVGRSWSARELRRKSFDDLHKLWLVLYKEKNMLLTEQQLSRRKQIIFPQPERLKKVGKSMGAIRQVLGERKRERIEQRKQAKEDELSKSQMEEEPVADNVKEIKP